MSTLSDLKARFFAAVTGKRNRTDAEMAYYGLAAAGAIPIVDPDGLETGDTLSWDADEESWVAGPGGGGGGGDGDLIHTIPGLARIGAGLDAEDAYFQVSVSGNEITVNGMNIFIGDQYNLAFQSRIMLTATLGLQPRSVAQLANAAVESQPGEVAFHEDLNKPVYFDGTDWCTFDGVPVS